MARSFSKRGIELHFDPTTDTPRSLTDKIWKHYLAVAVVRAREHDGYTPRAAISEALLSPMLRTEVERFQRPLALGPSWDETLSDLLRLIPRQASRLLSDAAICLPEGSQERKILLEAVQTLLEGRLSAVLPKFVDLHEALGSASEWIPVDASNRARSAVTLLGALDYHLWSRPTRSLEYDRELLEIALANEQPGSARATQLQRTLAEVASKKEHLASLIDQHRAHELLADPTQLEALLTLGLYSKQPSRS